MNTSIRTLESSVDKVSAQIINEESEYAPIKVHIDTIFIPVICKDNLALLDSVITSGLQKPLILVNNTEENYNLIAKRKGILKERNINKPFLCYAGCEKLSAVKKLGYDTVDALIVENIQWAQAVYKALNK